jgi:KDO2-lipid IV(A) lauroyltransferase
MERLKPESVYERFVAFREGLGMEVLPASGGNSRFGVLAQRLRAGKVVCLPADRDVTGSGIEVDFFGEKARMMPGPAALAVQTGAALVPAILWYTDDGWGVYFYPEIEVPADGDRKRKAAVMTQRLADVFAEGIRKHPADWHMLQPVFTADDSENAAIARPSAARGPEAAPGAGGGVRVGLVCPYDWEVPGGVQEHIRDPPRP